MLPIDKLSKEALDILERNQIKAEELTAVLRTDLDIIGDFGRVWLAISSDAKTLYRFTEDGEIFDRLQLALLCDPYIDNFTTTNRLLAFRRSDRDEEAEASVEGSVKETTVVAYCTNACKRKLFAFVNVWTRLVRGDEVLEDDPIFDQFNAKCPKCGTVYADQHRRICENCIKKKGTFIRLLEYFTPYKKQFIVVFFCLLASSAISLLTPIVSGQVLFDQVISAPSYDAEGVQITGRLHELKYVYIMVGVLVGMAVVSLLIGILQNRMNAYMSMHVTKNIKSDIFSAMQRLSVSFFNSNPTGRLINRVNYDAVKIRNFYIDGLPQFMIHSLNFIGLTIFLFSINWKLTLIVFIPIPIIVCIFKFMLPKLWKMYTKQWRASSSMNSMLGDSLNGVRVVKAFAKETEETNRFYKYATRLYNTNLRTNLITISIFPVVSLLIGMSSQAIWGFGGINVMNSTMTYGEFTTYLGYIGMIFGPLNFFTNFTNLVTDTMNSAQRMFETLDTVPEIVESDDAVKLEGGIKGDIEFDHVCFHYSPNRPILKDVSFKIHAGDHIGIVGHTGSGKSTIANLLTRMYDVISGTITIDGVDIKKLRVDTLRRDMAIVSQEVFIFSGTIADNIRYGKPEASYDEVIAAAKAANAHDFIMRLPEGYETRVGIGFRSLSGGERQRVSIARALLMSPSLLILDEATAAMDTETERLISEAIDRLVEGHTTITIAHRLSTLKNCNVIMAIENGEVAEYGPAEELLEKKGVYYTLYTLQNEQMEKVISGK